MKPPYDAALVLGVELGANDAPTDELARRVTAAAEVRGSRTTCMWSSCPPRMPSM